MPRARHPSPFEMWGIKPDQRSGRYILQEGVVTYSMTLEHTRLLKQYFRSNFLGRPSVENWYLDLDKETRKEIRREGFEQPTNDGFYPDPVYE